LKHLGLPKVVDFCCGFLRSIADISALSILLVLRGAIPGIHGRELLRRETSHTKEETPQRRTSWLHYSNIKEMVSSRS
jgi:hypothetical protein